MTDYPSIQHEYVREGDVVRGTADPSGHPATVQGAVWVSTGGSPYIGDCPLDDLTDLRLLDDLTELRLLDDLTELRLVSRPTPAVHACSGPSCAVCALPDDRLDRARTSDPTTSHAGGESVALRSGSQKARLLAAYYTAAGHGLTDDEAAEQTYLTHGCYWKRCSELRQDGYIYDLGITRRGPLHGEARIVCAITHKGIEAIA